MALTSDPPLTMHALWRLGISLPEAYEQFARDQGHPIGPVGALESVLYLLISQTDIIAKTPHYSSDLCEELKRDGANWRTRKQSMEARFRNGLARKINAGKSIAVGYRVYSPQRRDLKYVWDGRIRARHFDLQTGGYSGPQKQFEEIHILDRQKCPGFWHKKFERIREEKTGRPEIEEIRAVVAHFAELDSNFLEPSNHKRAVYDVQNELSELFDKGEISRLPALGTIDTIIRSQRRAQFSR